MPNCFKGNIYYNFMPWFLRIEKRKYQGTLWLINGTNIGCVDLITISHVEISKSYVEKSLRHDLLLILTVQYCTFEQSGTRQAINDRGILLYA